MSMFEFDESESAVLIVCNACAGTWRAFAWTMEEAEQRACAHEERAHPGVKAMRDRITTRRHKRRVRAKNA